MPVHWLPIAYIFNWGLIVKKNFVCASIFVTYSLNCKWIHNLPTERAIVCEDAINNSYAFVLYYLTLNYQFFNIASVCKNRIDFYLFENFIKPMFFAQCYAFFLEQKINFLFERQQRTRNYQVQSFKSFFCLKKG